MPELGDMNSRDFYPSETVQLATGCGRFYITVVFDLEKTRPIRLIAQAGKSGGCVGAQLHILTSAITSIFRIGEHYNRIKEYSNMTGTSCPNDNPRGANCLNKIGHYLIGMEMRNFGEKGGDDDG